MTPAHLPPPELPQAIKAVVSQSMAVVGYLTAV